MCTVYFKHIGYTKDSYRKKKTEKDRKKERDERTVSICIAYELVVEVRLRLKFIPMKLSSNRYIKRYIYIYKHTKYQFFLSSRSFFLLFSST